MIRSTTLYLILVTAFFMGCCTLPTIEKPPLPLIITAKIMKPCARLILSYSLYGNPREHHGSAVAVAIRQIRSKQYDIYLLTAAHVVNTPIIARNKVLQVQFFDEGVGQKLLYGEVIVSDSAKDLALIRIQTNKPQHISKIADDPKKIKVFREVFMVGCKLGMLPTPIAGLITTKKFEKKGNRFLWGTTAPIIFGNSGGGVFLKDTGELIGIAVSMASTGFFPIPHMAFFVGLPALHDFLEIVGYKWILNGDK